MKTILSILALIICSFAGQSQNVIQSDTTITKTISVDESFGLKFLNWPGTGYAWYLPADFDSTQVAIHLLKEELVEGDGPKGGRYISTYNYTGLANGTFLLEYVYGRPWLNEKINKCLLIINVK